MSLTDEQIRIGEEYIKKKQIEYEKKAAVEDVINIEVDLDSEKEAAIYRRRVSDLEDIVFPGGYNSADPAVKLFHIINLSPEDKKRFYETLTKEYKVDVDIKGLNH